MDSLGFLQIPKLYNFCFITPNSIFETNLESPQYKEQTHKISTTQEQCSLSYAQSKFCSKPSTLLTAHKLSQKLLKNKFSPFFLSSSGRGHFSSCPLPKAPLKALLHFLSTPFLILSKSFSFYLLED